MKHVTGSGGLFFQAKEPEKLCGWYRKDLGIEIDERAATFRWQRLDDPQKERYTVWSLFSGDTNYFASSAKPFMINFQVENLEQLLAELKKEDVDVDPRVEANDYGKFDWVIHPKGNCIDLWEPPSEQ
jgi:hypothetical protein